MTTATQQVIEKQGGGQSMKGKLLIIFLLLATTAHAEKFVCYDDVTKHITQTARGDCLNLGICSGFNNIGMLNNCFLATTLEFDEARQSHKKVDTAQSAGGRVIDWTQVEIDAETASSVAALTTSVRSRALVNADDFTITGVELRALIEVFNKRDNYLVNRIIELQNRVQAMIDSTGGVANMRTDGAAVSISATVTRTKASTVTDYKDEINSGGADN